MESMGKKPRKRRSFTPEFKAEIVELCQRGDRSVGQVAKGLRPGRDGGAGVGQAGRAGFRFPAGRWPAVTACMGRCSALGWSNGKHGVTRSAA
jgi:hypothetical protein